MDTKFIQIGDSYVVNVETVSLVKQLDDGEIEIYQIGDSVPIELEGKEARSAWAYFTATTANICPSHGSDK
jgi:hypothetical protein